MYRTLCEPFGSWQDRMTKAYADLRAGRGILLLDEETREDEADLIYAAELISEEAMTRLIMDCSGIVCLCLTHEKVQELELPQMTSTNTSQYGTGFTISIEAAQGVTTGVSAKDRVTTIRAAMAPEARPEDLARPGHVFPLRATPGGTRVRPGHTEGSVDLMRLAGLQPAAVLCELMNADGTMAKGQQVVDYAKSHDLTLLSIADLLHALELEESPVTAAEGGRMR